MPRTQERCGAASLHERIWRRDFDCHVYYPRELELLFRHTGFSVEGWCGDYAMRRLRTSSRQLIGIGVKGSDGNAVR